MFKWLKSLFSRDDDEPGWMVRDESGVHKLSDTEEYKLFKSVGINDTCPDCGGKGFYQGPSGGMSTNIFCMNRKCRSGFNITYFSRNAGTCERIHQGDLDRYPKEVA